MPALVFPYLSFDGSLQVILRLPVQWIDNRTKLPACSCPPASPRAPASVLRPAHDCLPAGHALSYESPVKPMSVYSIYLKPIHLFTLLAVSRPTPKSEITLGQTGLNIISRNYSTRLRFHFNKSYFHQFPELLFPVCPYCGSITTSHCESDSSIFFQTFFKRSFS